jgi:hypothetical protein
MTSPVSPLSTAESDQVEIWGIRPATPCTVAWRTTTVIEGARTTHMRMKQRASHPAARTRSHRSTFSHLQQDTQRGSPSERNSNHTGQKSDAVCPARSLVSHDGSVPSAEAGRRGSWHANVWSGGRRFQMKRVSGIEPSEVGVVSKPARS